MSVLFIYLFISKVHGGVIDDEGIFEEGHVYADDCDESDRFGLLLDVEAGTLELYHPQWQAAARTKNPAAESEGEGQGYGCAAEGTRIAQLAAAREGPSPAKELPTARAEETASLELRPAAILYARCTPGPGGGGVVRETRRAGERGDARAFEYALAVPAGSLGPPAPLPTEALPAGKVLGRGAGWLRVSETHTRWLRPGGACGGGTYVGLAW